MQTPTRCPVPVKPLIARTALLAMLAFAPWLAQAQPQQVERDGFVLRSSTVASDRISPETAMQHGIEPSPTRGVLNVVILKPGSTSETTVPARVSASMRNLAGQRQEIDMREVRAGGRVSYMGSYDFLPREVIDFEIRAQPEGGPTLALNYQDRMWAR